MSKKSDEKLLERYRVPFKGGFELDDYDPSDSGGFKDREEAEAAMGEDIAQLDELQRKLYAQSKHAVLVVLQAMDTAGKDGVIRNVFGPLNSQGVPVTSFKAPSTEERAHDYLWRIHKAVPGKGVLGIFNRSHYEDVLIVRVHKWAPPERIEQRYEQINNFEKHLAENDTTIVKFFLLISKKEQKERLEERLANPDKNWKFSADDLKERQCWDDYMDAYEKALKRCSTPWAPWYVIPANRKWFRNFLIARIMRVTLEGLDLAYPAPEEGLDKVRIED